MKKNIWNIIIDAVSLVIFMVMISTGLLLKFVLPPGSGRIDRLLREGRGAGKSIDLFMGWTRHEWGEIHFYICLAFLVLLIVHLSLHWSWIKSMAFGTKSSPQSLKRKLVAVGIILFIILSLIFPWIGKKQSHTKSEFFQIRNMKTFNK